MFNAFFGGFYPGKGFFYCIKIGRNIEPTSGIGNFLSASLNVFKEVKGITGIEINAEYCEKTQKDISDKRVQVINSNFFDYPLEQHIGEGTTLFLGNPPWATNSELNFNFEYS